MDEKRVRESALSRLARPLASLRLTLAGMLLLGISVLLSYRSPGLPAAWITLPLLVLAVNLLAALLYRPQFRRQSGLLVFHSCLFIIVLLAAWGIMTHFQARLEITEGRAFDAADVVVLGQGPWHRQRLDQVSFVQGLIRVDYHGAAVRAKTRSEVSVETADRRYRLRAGDTRGLDFGGYRFVATFNKGFAVMLTWLDKTGPSMSGPLHMPSYPLFEWNQKNRWLTPSGQALDIELKLAQAKRNNAWTLRSSDAQGRLLIRTAASAAPLELSAGQSAAFDGGVLRFDGLRLWMGYRIDYNPALAWMFAAAIVGILGLAHHFWRKFWRQPLSDATAVRSQLETGLESRP